MRLNPKLSREGCARARTLGDAPKPASERPLVPDDLPIGSTITALTPTKRDDRRVGVKVGGRYAGALPADLVQALGLKVGMVWTEEADEAFRDSIERDKARRYVLASVSRRAVSRARLAQALAKRGHSSQVIEATLDDVQRLGLIDDRALAESMARGLLSRSPSGARFIEQKLIMRGIAHDLAKEIAVTACAARDPLDDAITLANKKVSTGSRSADAATVQRRVYAALARRGFDPETCRVATQRAMAAREAIDEPAENHADEGAFDDV